MKLFTVATVRHEIQTENDGKQFEGTKSRCVAVCTTVERAVKIVEENIFDIYEMGHYPFAVIEEIDSDALYGGVPEAIPMWYKWMGEFDEGGYVRIATPEEWLNVIGWGIG